LETGRTLSRAGAWCTKNCRLAQLQLAYQLGNVGNLSLPTEHPSCFDVAPAVNAHARSAEIADRRLHSKSSQTSATPERGNEWITH
jgi:hypothetical protein